MSSWMDITTDFLVNEFPTLVKILFNTDPLIQQFLVEQYTTRTDVEIVAKHVSETMANRFMYRLRLKYGQISLDKENYIVEILKQRSLEYILENLSEDISMEYFG